MSNQCTLIPEQFGGDRLLYADWLEEQGAEIETACWRKPVIDLESFKADYDWQAAFQEAVNGSYKEYLDLNELTEHPIHHVSHVFVADDGENDGPDWICVVLYDDGEPNPVMTLAAGCDYTGWD